MEYHNFLIGLITASSIVFALVIYIITQIKERKDLLQKEYDDFGRMLTKFCRLCYFVCHDNAFFDYEKRIKNQRITLDITCDVKSFAKIVEHCAILENVKIDYLFDDLEKYKKDANRMWKILIDRSDKELKIDAYLSHPIPCFPEKRFSKLISDLSFGLNIDPDYFYLNYLGDIAGDVEVEIIDLMIDLSYKIKKQDKQYEKLICSSKGLFSVSILLPLVLLLFPCISTIYVCLILLIVFVFITHIIYCMLKEEDSFLLNWLQYILNTFRKIAKRKNSV